MPSRADCSSRSASRLAPGRLTAISAIAFGLLDLAIWNAPQLTTAVPVYVVLFIVVGMPGVAMVTGLLSVVQRATPDGRRGTVFAAFGVAASVGQAVGMIGGGLLGDRLGVVAVLNGQGRALSAGRGGRGAVAHASVDPGRAGAGADCGGVTSAGFCQCRGPHSARRHRPETGTARPVASWFRAVPAGGPRDHTHGPAVFYRATPVARLSGTAGTGRPADRGRTSGSANSALMWTMSYWYGSPASAPEIRMWSSISELPSKS